MPRSRTIPRYYAPQESVPSTRYWNQRALDLEEQAAQEDYEREAENWYRMNRGVQQPDGSYFGQELSEAPRLNYDPNVRQVGQPMRIREAYVQPSPGMERFSDFLLGYDPREGAEDYEPEYEEDPLYDAALLGFVPGAGAASRAARGIGAAAFGGIIGKDVAEGRRLGALDLAFMGGAAGAGARRLGQARKSFQEGFRRGRARRAYERALRKQALPQPGPNRRVFNGRRFEDRYVDPNMEYTPYEEVGF